MLRVVIALLLLALREHCIIWVCVLPLNSRTEGLARAATQGKAPPGGFRLEALASCASDTVKTSTRNR